MNRPFTVPTIRTRSPVCGVIDSARSIATSRTKRPSLSGRREVFGETIERAVPSAVMHIARSRRFENRVMQRQPGLAAEIVEQQRQRGLGTRKISLRIGPASDHHETLGWIDFAKDPLRPVIAVGTKHVYSICAARPQIVFLDVAFEAARPEPFRHVRGLGPRFEDEIARSVEHSLDLEHAIRGFGNEISCCSHDLSPPINPQTRYVVLIQGRQIFREMLERFGPSVTSTAARVSFNRVALMHAHSGPAAKLSERHRRHNFVAVVFHHAGPDNPLRLDDLAIDTVHPMLEAKAAHTEAKLAAGAKVHLADRDREVIRSKPSHQMLGLSPRLEHKRAGRIEDARDAELALPNRNLRCGTRRGLSSLT